MDNSVGEGCGETNTLSYMICWNVYILESDLVGPSMHTLNPGILVLRICVAEILAQMCKDKAQGFSLQHYLILIVRNGKQLSVN